MSEEELPKCKCGALLIIDTQHVIFKGGKVARIKCGGCNNNRLIKWELVKHLKEGTPEPVTEAVKPEPEEQPEEKDDLLKALDDSTGEKEAEEGKQDQGQDQDSSGAGWAVAAVAGLAGLFLLASGKNRG